MAFEQILHLGPYFKKFFCPFCPQACIKVTIWLLWHQYHVWSICILVYSSVLIWPLHRYIVGVYLMTVVVLPRLSMRLVSTAMASSFGESTSSFWTLWKTLLTGTEWLERGWWWSQSSSLLHRLAPTAAWTGTSNSELVFCFFAFLFMHSCMCLAVCSDHATSSLTALFISQLVCT